MTNLAFPRLAFAFGLLAAAPAFAQDWQKEWADTQARAKGQEFNLAVHSYEAHEAVVIGG